MLHNRTSLPANGSNFSSCPSCQAVYPPPFEFERYMDVEGMKQWLDRNFYLVPFACVEYLVLLYICKKIMKNKPAVHLKWSLFTWDAILAFVSLFGATRVVAELYHTLNIHGFEHSICVVSDIEHDTVYATSVFIFALFKVIELFDTLFIVLRKKKLIVLHWFHHFSVLIITTYGAKDRVAMGRWFISMNYSIHTFMYSYYAFCALKFKIPKEFSMCLTLMQILQMVVGCLLTLLVLLRRMRGEECAVSLRVISIGATLYLLYLSMFVQFFLETYLRKRSLKTQKTQ